MSKPPRKVRPKLVPILPGKVDNIDNSFQHSFDDGDLGFGEFLTTTIVAEAPPAAVMGGNDDGGNDNGSRLQPMTENGNGDSFPNQADGSFLSSPDDSSTCSSEESVVSSTSHPGLSESEPLDNQDAVNRNMAQLQQLQSEIRARQKQLTKIIRGWEGTSYATMIQDQEELVNSHLLARRMGRVTSVAPAAVRMSGSAIRSVFLDEVYHTLPGAMSLIVHCILYITTYSLTVKFVNLLCDGVIIYFTGWDIKENDFDTTLHEHLFHATLLIVSLLASRITGAIYDWNDNKKYQKRIAFQVRNKWILKYWDARLLNYFCSDCTREKYGDEVVGCQGGDAGKKQNERKKMLSGWRVKYMIDLFSFFCCYKCIDHFLYTLGLFPMSDITDTVWGNLPSRQKLSPVQPLLHHRSWYSSNSSAILDVAFDERQTRNGETYGVSYACPNVMSAFENPYTLDILNWIARMELESDELKNWIANAKNCGWSGVAGEEDIIGTNPTSGNGMENSECDNMECSANEQILSTNDEVEDHDVAIPDPGLGVVNNDDAHNHLGRNTQKEVRHVAGKNEGNSPEHGTGTRSSNAKLESECNHHLQKRIMSVQDDSYIRSTISREAYYELIRNPIPRFFHPVGEPLFWFGTTVICLGLLYACDIPFLLI